jgi:predicted regulator of Ras-like GTPase activity (Roadblock/LC7/MglB family)
MLDEILRDLIDAVPGARGAVFCDPEGETISSVGASGRTDQEKLDDYDLRVAGAQFATPLHLAMKNSGEVLGEFLECTIAGGREKILIHMLPEHYYVVLCLAPESLIGCGLHHLRTAAELLRSEI